MMSLSVAMNSAFSGMAAQQSKLAVTASNTANALTPGYERQQVNFTSSPGGVAASVIPTSLTEFKDTLNVDLATEMQSLVEAEIGIKANASVWETGADMWDVLMSINRD